MEKKTTTSKKSAAAKSNGGKHQSMPAKSKPAVNDSMLEEFFHDELKDIYWAEKHLVKTLPKMQKAATTSELKNAFADHLAVTKTHVQRLEQVFSMLDHKPQAKKCEAMEGLTKEGESIIEDTEEGTATRDVGLIFAAQKVEHYEIATYGGLTELAKTLGRNDIAEILFTTLGEERAADESLTGIAEYDINYQAAEEVES